MRNPETGSYQRRPGVRIGGPAVGRGAEPRLIQAATQQRSSMMGKNDYLDALKRAMAGIPAEAQAKTLAYYEQRFIDGAAAGMSEEEVAKDLDDPKKIAMTLRANTHMDAFTQKKNPANAVRMLVSALGLAIFNLFMVVPAMVYASLLATVYACAVAFYLFGVAVTAISLSGTNTVTLKSPVQKWAIEHDLGDRSGQSQTRVSISEQGINVYQDKGQETEAERAAAAAEAEEHGDPDNTRSERVIRRAEAVAERGIVISNDLDSGSRTSQTLFGIGMVLGGIALFLLSLVITKYTFIGIRRYIDMNISLLKGS
jgi:uncharacterized membrane protein